MQLIQIGESKMADGSSIVKGHWCFSQLLDFTLTIKVFYRFMDSFEGNMEPANNNNMASNCCQITPVHTYCYYYYYYYYYIIIVFDHLSLLSL